MDDKKEDIIKVRNLYKNFKDVKAVRNISFDVKRGEIFAFLGPNGAGKSTTIKILTTILHPSKGEVFVNGYNVCDEQDKVTESFGIVFQDSSVDTELTAYENMDFHAVLYRVPNATRKKKIRELLEYVNLWDRKDSLVKTFSGGMIRRLEVDFYMFLL